MKYYGLEIGTGRVCSNTAQVIIDAYGCIVYRGDDIEVIKTEMQPSTIPPSYLISYIPTYASLEQYKSAAVYHVNTHEYENKEQLIQGIELCENIESVDAILML